MADTRHEFTKKELEKHKRSGALGFMASVVGMEVDDLLSHHTKRGVLSGVGDTKDGRDMLASNLHKLSNKDFDAANEAGFIEVLGLAWGVTPERVAKVRATGYSRK